MLRGPYALIVVGLARPRGFEPTIDVKPDVLILTVKGHCDMRPRPFEWHIAGLKSLHSSRSIICIDDGSDIKTNGPAEATIQIESERLGGRKSSGIRIPLRNDRPDVVP